MPRIAALDGLRGIAVLLVVAYHYLGLPMGWAGVDVFFVLSGYLITSRLVALRGSDHYFKDFYARRARRIWPLAYLLLAVYTVGLVSVGWPVLTDRVWWSHVFMTSSWDTVRFHESWPLWILGGFNVWWSLSIEEWFYVGWAPVVAFTRKATLPIVLVILILSPIVRGLVHDASGWEYAWFPVRLDALAWGALIVLWPSLRYVSLKWVCVAGVIALVGISGGRESLLMAVLGYSAIAATVALVISWLVSGKQFPALTWTPLRNLGAVSYGVYLIHLPVWFLMPGGTLTKALLGSLVTLGLSALSWKYLEQPLLKKRVKVASETARLRLV